MGKIRKLERYKRYKRYKGNKRNKRNNRNEKIFIITLLIVFMTIVYYPNKNSVVEKNKLNLDIIIPLGKKHASSFNANIKFYKKYLNYTNLIILSQSDSFELIEKDNSIKFINENTLISKEAINKFLQAERSVNIIRDFWYEQQFLKMAYSRICKNEYYLIWDSDTIPIKFIRLFENDHPFFDMKTEHNIPYFQAMERLLPNLKLSDMSYISEHQIIKTEYMKNLLDEIENNSKLKGKFFWEKILMAINLNDLNYSGFSEYETYGTFVDTRYPNFYNHRKWFSLRYGTNFFNNASNLNENDIIWLSKDFHAISFEKWDICKFNEQNLDIVKNSSLQKKYTPNIFFDNFNLILSEYKKN